MKAVDIPQADSLSRVRELVQSVKFGATDVARLQKVMTLHPRHVGYHLHAARILNWMVKENDEWSGFKFELNFTFTISLMKVKMKKSVACADKG